ncbi:MAG: EamA family transporter [Vallitaleaceae bacterium]|nr:EamA family transporter [Vallitaleaceae bacterium]
MYIVISKRQKGVYLIIVSAFFASIGQLLWKLSNGELNIQLVTGFLLYGLGAIIMIIAFKYEQLSVLQPLLSTSYIMSLILGHLCLNEIITLRNVLGVIIVVLGVIILSSIKEM